MDSLNGLEFAFEQVATEKPSAAICGKGDVGESPQPTTTEAHIGHKRQTSATVEHENTSESKAKNKKVRKTSLHHLHHIFTGHYTRCSNGRKI